MLSGFVLIDSMLSDSDSVTVLSDSDSVLIGSVLIGSVLSGSVTFCLMPM